MYIRKIEITNIRSIGKFEMEFPEGEEAGWHVLIGDNGSGKSSVIRAISLALIGSNDAQSLDLIEDWSNWLQKEKTEGSCKLTIVREDGADLPNRTPQTSKLATSNLKIYSQDGLVRLNGGVSQQNALYGKNAGSGWFSAAYGPFRRLDGGADQYNHLYRSRPRVAAHLSAFSEAIALTEPIRWLKDLALDASNVEEGKTSKERKILTDVINFINQSGLLLHGATLKRIDSKGLYIVDGNGIEVTLNEMSDGYRSILSLILELLRRLVEVYTVDKLFNPSNPGKVVLPGIVLIDEVDVHLHPTWQVDIGKWFLEYFPNIQFIVTTHSPLICRACKKGSIWRLAAPGSNKPSGKVPDEDKDKLIYGNILDAYGTDVFGDDIERDEDSLAILERLGRLSQKVMYGMPMTAPEKQEYQRLKKIFQTDATLAI